MAATNLAGFRFEVWGKVQGVFFRKHTKLKAHELGVAGWIRNHKVRGTVQGECASDNIQSRNQMKVWLQSVGSPMSMIEKADFEPLEDENHVAELISKGMFDVRKSVRQ
jgi:acylphosphatase